MIHYDKNYLPVVYNLKENHMTKLPEHMGGIIKLYSDLLSTNPVDISTHSKSIIPDEGGVYIIMDKGVLGPKGIRYVARSKNLRTRICKNHIRKCKGAFGRYLVREGIAPAGIGAHIRVNFVVKFVLEKDFRTRGLLEAYATALLSPKYGIDEEH